MADMDSRVPAQERTIPQFDGIVRGCSQLVTSAATGNIVGGCLQRKVPELKPSFAERQYVFPWSNLYDFRRSSRGNAVKFQSAPCGTEFTVIEIMFLAGGMDCSSAGSDLGTSSSEAIVPEALTTSEI